MGSSIFGTVTDQNGALVSGASISLWNEQTKAVLYTGSDSNGQFRFDGLEAGLYYLRIEAIGFAVKTIDSFYLQPSNETRIDPTLSTDSPEGEADRQETRTFVTGGAVAFVAPEHPFVRAAQEDNLQALQAEIPGIDVNMRDKRSGTTALEHAARNANREMVQLLLSAGANVNLKNERGETVLMMLDSDATTDLVWDLINAGAKVNLETESGNTALMEAAIADNLEAVKTLLDAGAKVDAKNKGGQTALMLAAAEGYVNIVRTLVAAGADVNVVDKEGKNALALADEGDHPAVARYLRSQGAVALAPPAKKDQ